MNVERPSQKFKIRCASKLPPTHGTFEAPMSTTALIAAMKATELDLHSAATVNSVPYYRVCMDDSHLTPKCVQINDVKALNRTRMKNFYYWRHRLDVHCGNVLSEGGGYRQKHRTQSGLSQPK